jgi:hypothetical protein
MLVKVSILLGFSAIKANDCIHYIQLINFLSLLFGFKFYL